MSSLLFSNELILESIFNQLGNRELVEVGYVCKLWHWISKSISQKRNAVVSFFNLYAVNFFFNDDPVRFKHFHKIPIVNRIEDVQSSFLNFLEVQQKCLPRIAFAFHHTVGVKNFFNPMRKYLPSNCDLIYAKSDSGIISKVPNSNESVETMADDSIRSIAAFSILLLPDFGRENCEYITISSDAQFVRYHDDETLKKQKIKCILVFMGSQSTFIPNLFKLINKSKNKIALGGSVTNKLLSNFALKSKFSAVMFCGENLKAASLMILHQVRPFVHQSLVDFKRTLDFDVDNFDEDQFSLIGFLFACSGRGYDMYGDFNVETDLINFVFPKMQLYGIFGVGELGNNNTKCEPFSVTNPSDCVAYLTSTLVILKIPKRKTI